MENVKGNVNPFATDISKDFLFNISTGQAADENVAEFLLNAEKMGDEQRQQFIKECIEDSNRFERVIKQNKIINFASMQKKKKSHWQEKLQKFACNGIYLHNYCVYH